MSVVYRIALFSAGAALSCWALAVHAEAKTETKPGRTEISSVPWKAAPLPPGKVTYGTDDRRDVFEETDAARRALADSTCALVDEGALSENGDGSFALDLSAYNVLGLPPCDDEPFANQPVAAFCTGFMVGPDLIATAGHCISEFDLPYVRFVFGFRMEDAETARSTFDVSEVYSGVEIVAERLEGEFDFAIVRVERAISAPGARVLPLRGAGTIAPGTQVGVIGHPAGLPTKIAFGDTTVVRSSGEAGYFVANLDSYGGNSGSPVFNAGTGVVEGILVRGEGDFDFDGDCFRSRVLPDTGGAGEEVSKSTTFASFVQISRGTLSLNKASYQCTDSVEISLYDFDLQGVPSAEVRVITLQGDSETVALAASDASGTFSGSIAVEAGDLAEDSGVLEAAEGDTILVAYGDDDVGGGSPGDAVATARVDCTAPVITEVMAVQVGGSRAQIAFTTNEPASGTVMAGAGCGDMTSVAVGDVSTGHLIEVSGLTMETVYFFGVMAADAAGNTAADNNGGACYSFTTTDQRDYLTEGFLDGSSDLAGLSVAFVPSDTTSGYTACVNSVDEFPTSPFCGEALSLGDDDFVEYRLKDSQPVRLFGQEYDSFFVGSNGYITFDAGDVTYDPSFEAHLAQPRISPYFGDLYPPAGGLISVAELPDRVAVSYFNVLDYFGDLQSFQVELFFDGTIRMTWLVLTRAYAIVGLSEGGGLPLDFEESDLSAYAKCDELPYEDVVCENSIVNDGCADAVTVAVGETYTGSTAAALGSADTPGCDFCYSQDVWYAFTPPTTRTYTVSLCGSSFDTTLQVFTGDCGGLSLVAENDDSFCGAASEVEAELTAGTAYLIRVSGYENFAGNFTLALSSGAKGAVGCNGGQSDAPNGGASVITGLLLLFAGALAVRAGRPGARLRGPGVDER